MACGQEWDGPDQRSLLWEILGGTEMGRTCSPHQPKPRLSQLILPLNHPLGALVRVHPDQQSLGKLRPTCPHTVSQKSGSGTLDSFTTLSFIRLLRLKAYHVPGAVGSVGGPVRDKKTCLPSQSSVLGKESEGGQSKCPRHLPFAHGSGSRSGEAANDMPFSVHKGQIRTAHATGPTGAGLKPELTPS